MFDGELRELVAVAVELAIALATLLVEDEDLVALYQGREHFTYYLGAVNDGSTYGYAAIVVNEQHLLKFNSLTGFGLGDVVDKKLLAFLCLELLTVNLYDCVHLKNNINGFFREANNVVLLLFRASAD